MKDSSVAIAQGLALPLINSVMTAPEQSHVTSEPQQVVTPLTGRAGGGASLMGLRATTWRRAQDSHAERHAESEVARGGHDWESLIVRQMPRPGCSWYLWEQSWFGPVSDMQVWKGRGKGPGWQGGTEAPRNCALGVWVLHCCQLTKKGARRGLLSLGWARQS